ncbi:MAG: hypothetical protein PWQ96_226 [Clostridia bacterium]|jgi:hypothetical protein|nr:hypothetical protein [Clostridiales bacterium]MDK2984584.1 hypothetical protein [Clostridia bacterium]
MAVYLEDRLLLEYIVAVILRENGYVAGIPRRLLYGRSAGHHVPVIGIERSSSPFCYHNIIISLVLNSSKSDEQLETLYRLRAILTDLDHTLPPQMEVLPELFKGSVGEYFHKIYGNSRYEQERLSVHYKGIMFSTTKMVKNSWNYANSNGIFIVYFPGKLAGKDLGEWLSLLKLELNAALLDKLITIPSLKRHTRKQNDYRRLLQKIRKKDYLLLPEEYHDLLTVIYALLRKNSLRPFLNHIRSLTLASIDNFPILLEVKNISTTALIEGCASFYLNSAKKQRSRSKSLTERLSLLGEVNELYDGNLYRITCHVDRNHYIQDSLRQMKLYLYLDSKKVDSIRNNKSCLRLNLKEGLSLIAEVSLLN